MSRFNAVRRTTQTTNFAGGHAYRQSAEMEFISILATTFLHNQYYRRLDDTAERIQSLIDKVGLRFAAQAAIYARTKLHIRSATHLVAAEVALRGSGEGWIPNFIYNVVERVDDMTEIMAYALVHKKKSLPIGLKKGLRDAFAKFDDYQLGKYKAQGKDVSLVDVINLVHPKPTASNAKALRALVKGESLTSDTWETRLTQIGQLEVDDVTKDQLKAEAWDDLLTSATLGYFALLRNLRNIVQQAPASVLTAVEMLCNEDAIRRSRVLPFRFLTAMQQFDGKDANSRLIISAIEEAAEKSLGNVPRFDGHTCVVVDESYSMINSLQKAWMFGAMLAKKNDADLMSFSNHARYRGYQTSMSMMGIVSYMMENVTAGGTNFHAIFQEMSLAYDRIIILSDMQGWIGTHTPTVAFRDYRMQYGADPMVYSFDMEGYGTLQFPERNVFCLAGLSEQVFEIMKMLESDRGAMVNAVKAMRL